MASQSGNSILQGLNACQRHAVENTEGPLLIVAGAGSGKTRALTHRAAYLIYRGVPASQILCLTFTNKAADEMRRRIATLTMTLNNDSGPNRHRHGSQPFIGTFHSFAASFLRREAHRLGYRPGFSIFDEGDSESLMKEVFREESEKIQDGNLGPGAALAAISFRKNQGLDEKKFSRLAESNRDRLLLTLWRGYEKKLLDRNAFDFDNLLLKAVSILRRFPEVSEKEQRRCRYILVDEYQDTNRPQYEILKILSKRTRNLCVVGDIDQAIYGFRGADFRNILLFEKDWREAKIVRLEENYRSTKTIIGAADAIIEKNQDRLPKKMHTENPAGSPIHIAGLKTERDEAVFAAKKILEHGSRAGSLRDIAILFRTNAQSRIFEETFLEYRIPYQLIGGFKFYRRREILDIIGYLRLAQNPSDIGSLKRVINVPPRGIGKSTLQKFRISSLSSLENIPHSGTQSFLALMQKSKHLSRAHPPSQLLRWLMEEIEYKNYLDPSTEEGRTRWENVQELLGVAAGFDHLPKPRGLEQFLEGVSLMQEIDDYDPEKDRVTLMTIHSAKGLEFPIIFIVGCEEGIFPHERSIFAPGGLEEERRLAYVAFTRAKEEVYASFAHRRFFRGIAAQNPPSRFLSDIPEHLVNFSDQAIFSGETAEEGENIQLE